MAQTNDLKATTGVDEFYYAVLTADDEKSFTASEVTRVPFLQEITVEMPQSIERAYGDNRTAELAVSNGNTTITTRFHNVPEKDKEIIFGLETNVNGLSAYGSDDTPPYIAAVFAKTYEDGSKQWIGLPKGMFMRSNIAGETKGEGVTFSSDEVNGEFMERYVPGFDGEKTVLRGKDSKGETAARDAMFTAIFAAAHPDAPVVDEGV